MKYRNNDIWRVKPHLINSIPSDDRYIKYGKTGNALTRNQTLLLTGKSEIHEWGESYVECVTIMTHGDESQSLSLQWMIREDLLKKFYKFDCPLTYKIPYAMY